jgi:hypothetical protein
VTIVKPYFRIVDLQALSNDRCAFHPLEADKDFHVTRDALETFEPLVERFLLNGKTNFNTLAAKDCQDIKV